MHHHWQLRVKGGDGGEEEEEGEGAEEGGGGGGGVDSQAQLRLGLCYQEGVVLEKNEAKAVECFRKAATGEKGDAAAQFHLSLCYKYVPYLALPNPAQPCNTRHYHTHNTYHLITTQVRYGGREGRGKVCSVE